MGSRRTNGEGTVWRLKNGTWRGQLMDGYDDNGKKIIVSFSAETRAEVLDLIRDYRNNKDANVHIDKKLTLAEWGKTWYEDYESQVQASTYSGYRYTLRLIEERLGKKAVADILPLDINRFQDGLVKDGYSLSQVRKCRTMLIQIFDAADENGMILRNPARKAKILKDRDGTLSAPRRTKDAFTAEEINLLDEKLNDDLLGHSIRLMLNTGLRTQELLALAPNDIAEDGSSVDINKAVKTVAGKPNMGLPKSIRSRRIVPVPKDARSSALYLREHGGTEHIWSLPGKNAVYGVGSFRRRYYYAIKQVEGVRKLSPHCCRHTYVTRLQAKGVPIEIIAQLAGHSSVDTTVGYTHTTPETLSGAVAVLDKDADRKENN